MKIFRARLVSVPSELYDTWFGRQIRHPMPSMTCFVNIVYQVPRMHLALFRTDLWVMVRWTIMMPPLYTLYNAPTTWLIFKSRKHSNIRLDGGHTFFRSFHSYLVNFQLQWCNLHAVIFESRIQRRMRTEKGVAVNITCKHNEWNARLYSNNWIRN